MQNSNARQRDVEQRLGRVESPEPPADLLERIQADIPQHLRPAETPPGGGRRALPYRLLAASVFLAVVGGVVAYRVFQEAPPPEETVATFEALRFEAPPPPTTTEIGGDSEAVTPTAEAPVAEIDTTSGRTEMRVPVPDPTPGPVSMEQSLDDGRELEASDTDLVFDAPVAAAPPELSQVRAEEEQKRENRLRNLGYLGGEKRRAEDEALRGQLRSLPGAPPPPQETSVSTAPGRPDRQRPVPKPKSKVIGIPVPPPTVAPSTGGTTEPNDQLLGDMFFRGYGTNPFVDTEDDPLSTFGLDVDTGSYTLARGYLERGHLPPPEAIRVEEFVNFFDYGDPAPRRGEFTMTVEGAPSPWRRGPRYQLLRVGLHGREISTAQRLPATLIFVVDVSGSMARENRIGLVQRALEMLLDQLDQDDRVGLVVYGSHGQILLEPSADLRAVRRAVDRLRTGGSTNAEEGLVLAYDLARRHFRRGAINRLVLCSDGVANVGATGPESILQRIGREADEGIELTTVGFGMGNYNDVLMEQLADQGDGNYAYVDTIDEARRVFVENLTGTLQTIASDAKIQVEFDPRVVSRYRLLGYENRDVADHRFRDDTVDAGEIGAGHQVTALYEVKLTESAPRRRALAEIRLRYRSKATGQVIEDSLAVRPAELAGSWRASTPSLRLAALAAELAEVLKRSYWVRELGPGELLERARAVEREHRGDSDVAELVRLVRRAVDLADWSQTPPE